MKPGIVTGAHQHANEPQFYSPTGTGDRGEDFIQDNQIACNELPTAPDSIKEGWLNCKISNIDGKVYTRQKYIMFDLA